MKLGYFLLPILMFIAGCASYQYSQIDTNAMKGKNVDLVISELQSKGYVCSEKKSIYVKVWKKTVGTLGCGTRESSLVCPQTYGISIDFDLNTNLITTALKVEHSNCF